MEILSVLSSSIIKLIMSLEKARLVREVSRSLTPALRLSFSQPLEEEAFRGPEPALRLPRRSVPPPGTRNEDSPEGRRVHLRQRRKVRQ